MLCMEISFVTTAGVDKHKQENSYFFQVQFNSSIVLPKTYFSVDLDSVMSYMNGGLFMCCGCFVLLSDVTEGFLFGHC